MQRNQPGGKLNNPGKRGWCSRSEPEEELKSSVGAPIDSQCGTGPGSGSGVSKDSLGAESWLDGCWCHSLSEGTIGRGAAGLRWQSVCVSMCVSVSEVCVC